MTESIVILSIAALGLLIATIVFTHMKKTKPYRDFSNIMLRIKTWWGMLAIFTVATLFHSSISLLSLMLLCFLALKEYFSMMRTRKADRQLFIWAYLAIPIQFYWIYIDWYGMYIVFIPVYIFLLLPMARVFRNGTLGFLRSVSSTQWGLMLMVFGLSHLAYYQTATPQYGAELVLYLVVLTQVSDVVHNYVSIYFGKHKVVPTANPAITWEGFAASLVATTLLAWVLYPHLTPVNELYGILSGSLICIAGFFGMLTISVLKRDLLIGNRSKFDQLKDQYLNRVDSLTYTAPVFFHVTRYFFDFM